MPIESIIGIIIIVFMALAMTRKIAILVAKKMPDDADGKQPNFVVKTLMWLSKYHRLFGITAFLMALLHGVLIFAKTGSGSISGLVLIIVLALQGASGYILEKRIGNQKVASTIHTIVPFIATALVVAHIVVNGIGY
ncbi:MAG TPA: hypothetical protein PK340_06015 [Bacilli bacterium]|nr:hypothetical protein [Bacilli bacterium]